MKLLASSLTSTPSSRKLFVYSRFRFPWGREPEPGKRLGVDIAALDNVAVTAVREALERKAIVVIDEIGRMELSSEQFRRAVLDALASDRVVLAAIHAHPHPFTDGVKARPDVRIFQVTAENRSTLPSVLGDLISGLLGRR